MGLDKFEEFDDAEGVNDAFAEQGGVVGVREALGAVKEPGGDEIADGLRFADFRLYRP
jgi:hypothetical protein